MFISSWRLASPLVAAVLLGVVLDSSAGESAPSPVSLQAWLDPPPFLRLSGSVRVREELLSGQPRAGLATSTDLFGIRSTFAAEYRNDWLRVGGELYDSRAYPERPTSGVSANEVNAFELVQAYVGADLGDAFGAGSRTSVQVGRMVLNLGSRRLVAADDYRNTTSGYTGARFDVRTSGNNSAILIYTMPQVRLPDDLPSILENDVEFDRESDDLVLWGGLFTLPAVAPFALDLSYFRLDEKDRADLPTRNRHLDTTGARAYRDPSPGRFDYEFEGHYQTGTIRAGTAPTAARLDVDAYFYHLEVGRQWNTAWRPRVSFEYDYASGDAPGGDYQRFDTLFGMRRADLSPSGIYAVIGRTNVKSPGVRVEVTPNPRVDGTFMYRALWLAERTDSFSSTGVRDATGTAGDFGGHQLDLRVRYWIVPQLLRFETNVVLLDKGRFLKTAPNTPTADDTQYLSVSLLATF